MHSFASGFKRNYYGKGDVIAYRLHRDGSAPVMARWIASPMAVPALGNR